jgi:hypothetical protein
VPYAAARFIRKWNLVPAQELAEILKRHFANVLVFENISHDQFERRHNLYFYASDGGLPFDPDWRDGVRS